MPQLGTDRVWELAQGTIRDALISSDDSRFAYILNPTVGSAQVAVLDPSSGTHTPVLTNETAPWRIAYGRKRELYVLTFPLPDFAPARVKCVNADSATPNTVTATRDIGTSWCTAIAFDDATDKVLVLNPTTRRIYTLSAGLPGGEPLNGPAIPGSVPLHATQGTMAVNPVDGKIWFASPSATKLFNVIVETVSEINIPGVTTITGIDFDDMGHLYVTADGAVKEFEQTGPNQWQQVANPYLTNFTSSQRVVLSRSRTNYDPGLHLPSIWTNIHPDELAAFAPGVSLLDCLADINDDRAVNIDDLLAVVNNWGAPRPNVANIDQSDFVNIDDLLAVINAWGLCP
jgi:hypothetical protein